MTAFSRSLLLLSVKLVMFLLPYVVVLVLLPEPIRTQTCSPRPTLLTTPAPVHTGKRLGGYEVSHLMGFDLERCAQECFFLTACESFNFRELLGVCVLNGATVAEVGTATLETDAEFEYHDLAAWSAHTSIAGTCAIRPCAENQRCVPSTPYTCVNIDCGPPPMYFLPPSPEPVVHLTATTDMTSIGGRTSYRCNRTKSWLHLDVIPNADAPFLSQPNKVCNSDGRWSSNAPTCTSSFLICDDIKECSTTSTQDIGHYWTYMQGNISERVKLFCDRIDDPTRTAINYVTLPNSNTVSHNAGDGITGPTTTTWNKLRSRNAVHFIHLTAASYTTTAGPAGRQSLGYAASCHGDGVTTPKIYGYFKIDLTGTGLKVNPDTTWTADPGCELVDFTMEGGVVEGKCWGTCGCQCYPDGNIELVPNLDDNVDTSDVIDPTCDV